MTYEGTERSATAPWNRCPCQNFRRLSGFAAAPDYPDVAPLARALIAANPDRLVWGSDWPHPDSYKVAGRKPTDIAPALPIDDGRVLNLLAEWAPDAATRKAILVDNPKRLYGF